MFSPRVLLKRAFSYYKRRYFEQLFPHVNIILIFNLIHFRGMSVHKKLENKKEFAPTCQQLNEDARGRLRHFSAVLVRDYSSPFLPLIFVFSFLESLRLLHNLLGVTKNAKSGRSEGYPLYSIGIYPPHYLKLCQT